MILREPSSTRSITGIPRESGDDPLYPYADDSGMSYSPRERG